MWREILIFTDWLLKLRQKNLIKPKDINQPMRWAAVIVAGSDSGVFCDCMTEQEQEHTLN